jgi:hypothetical protein
MFLLQLTIFRDGYNDIRLYREDQLHAVDVDIAKCISTCYGFKLELCKDVK